MGLGLLGWLALLLFSGCGGEEEGAVESQKIGTFSTSGGSEKGRYVFPDGSVYDGELVGSKPEGYGEQNFVNENLYVGHFRDGRAHGQARHGLHHIGHMGGSRHH